MIGLMRQVQMVVAALSAHGANRVAMRCAAVHAALDQVVDTVCAAHNVEAVLMLVLKVSPSP